MNRYTLFLLLIAFYSIFAALSGYLLLSDTLFFNSLAEQLTYDQIQEVISSNKKWEWLSYVVLPVVILIKIFFVAMCLSIGAFFVRGQFMFRLLFGAALVAEFVFLVPVLLKILWFSFVQTDYTLQDLQFFMPLSLLSFFEPNSVEPWLVYPLQLCNIFEIAYWVILAKQIQQLPTHEESDFTASFQMVLASYGAGLVLWVATVMFISVSYS